MRRTVGLCAAAGRRLIHLRCTQPHSLGCRLPLQLSLRSPHGSASRLLSTVAHRDDVRNIAIVAHVDHGKTTLVDALLQSTKGEQIGKDERQMDHNDQERERGITILAKNAAVSYEGVKVNIVDTPGHADFGGEVERVLNMVDGVLLVVDAAEGPKPQTRFVLKKALALGHKVLVVLNKIDKPNARPDHVIDKTFDLFCELGASDEQTDFPVVYTSALNRIAGDDPDAMSKDMKPLLDAIIVRTDAPPALATHPFFTAPHLSLGHRCCQPYGSTTVRARLSREQALPKPRCDESGPLQLQISNIGSDPFIGRLGIGRIKSGSIKKGMAIGLSGGPGTEVKPVTIKELFLFDAMERTAVRVATPPGPARWLCGWMAGCVDGRPVVWMAATPWDTSRPWLRPGCTLPQPRAVALAMLAVGCTLPQPRATALAVFAVRASANDDFTLVGPNTLAETANHGLKWRSDVERLRGLPLPLHRLVTCVAYPAWRLNGVPPLHPCTPTLAVCLYAMWSALAGQRRIRGRHRDVCWPVRVQHRRHSRRSEEPYGMPRTDSHQS